MVSVRSARSLALTTLAGLGLCLACAAPTSPPATASAPAIAHDDSEQAKTPPAADPPAAQPASASAPAAAPTEAEQERDGLRKASRPPLDLLTGNNVVYMFNFAASAAGISAKQHCDGDDPRASRECLDKARAKLAVESVRFVKDQSGQYWWVTYNRYKGNLLKWHKVQFAPGKEDADTISLNLIGKDKGIAPMARVPAKLKIELPNDYSIVISDPEHGDMLYDAKIGLMEAD